MCIFILNGMTGCKYMYDKNYSFSSNFTLDYKYFIYYIRYGTVYFNTRQFLLLFVLTKYLNNKKIIIIHYDTEIKLTQS